MNSTRQRIAILLAVFALLLGLGTACAPTPEGDAFAVVTETATAQTITPATQMTWGLSNKNNTTVSSPSPAPSASMPSSEACAEESEPFWHWQAGRVNVKGFFFVNSSAGFAVGDPYTLLRTDDGGSSWRVWYVDSPHPLNTIYFSNQAMGWVAGDGGTILSTTDGGITWQPQHTGTKADLLVIKFLDDQTGWAGGSNGVLLCTTDGGASWSAGATGYQMNIVDVAFIDTQEGYLAGIVGRGPLCYVLHTTDGGATWENTDFWVSGVPKAIYAAKGMPTWIVGGWVGGHVWKGIGHGSKTKIIDNMGNGHFREVLFSDAQHGWAVGDCGLAIFTEDGGEYWQPMGVHESADWKMLRFMSEQDAVLAGYSWVDDIQIAHSSDGGRTWSPAPVGGSPTHGLDVLDMDFVDPWFGWAVVQNNSWSPTALLATRDGGQLWERHEVLGGRVHQVEFVDRLRGWAIGEAGLIARSDDGGRSWEIQSILFPEDLQAISIVDRDHGWVVSAKTGPGTCQEFRDPYPVYPEYLTLFRTASGGDEWEGPICIEVPEGTTTSFAQIPPRLQFVDNETGWITGAEGLILKTTDGALNWQVQVSGTAVDLTDVYFLDEQTGWVTGDKGVLLQTTDGGAHWKQQRVGNSKLTGVRFVDNEIGWLTTSWAGKEFYTSDGGRTWNAILDTYERFDFPDDASCYSFSPTRYISLDAIDEHHVWAGGHGGITAYTPVCLSPPKP